MTTAFSSRRRPRSAITVLRLPVVETPLYFWPVARLLAFVVIQRARRRPASNPERRRPSRRSIIRHHRAVPAHRRRSSSPSVVRAPTRSRSTLALLTIHIPFLTSRVSRPSSTVLGLARMRERTNERARETETPRTNQPRTQNASSSFVVALCSSLCPPNTSRTHTDGSTDRSADDSLLLA